MAMGCQQCLPLSVVQLKGKHCQKPHCGNGVVDTFGQKALKSYCPHIYTVFPPKGMQVLVNPAD